jgi:peroxiredoxin
LPSVNKLYTDFREGGFEVLLISFREDPDVVRRTVQERGYVAPVLLDQSGEVTGKVYGVWGPPASYFVDRQGRLRGRISGPRPWASQAARDFVQALLDASRRR